MSDLSRLLGDVYRSGPAAPDTDDETSTGDTVAGDGDDVGTNAAPGQATTLSGALPEWADESVLDEAFANWVPGPPSDAPHAERGMLADLAGAPSTGDARPTSLADAVPSASDFMFPQAGGEATTTEPATVAGRWQRTDDDLLPVRGRGHSRRRKSK